MQNQSALSFKKIVILLLCICAFSIWNGTVFAQSTETLNCTTNHRYTFSWSLKNICSHAAPRGGSSKGAPIELDSAPHAGWLSLQEKGLSKHEQDRRAILAMAGPYRTSFEFIEAVGYTPNFTPDRPYQSWGTEYIYVVEDSADFISLQHIMVMFVDMGKETGIVGPIVQKHWRQDWQFEKSALFTFKGDNTWSYESFTKQEIEGTWTQSVFQVDDSPRYEAFGRWQHKPNFSTWLSESTWRPVPRRESSVRQDYDLLEGTNRHTILINGWVHEEQNYKVQLEQNGSSQYLSKELGVNRYERIVNFDFSAGDDYWSETKQYWADVRLVWQSLFEAKSSLKLKSSYEGTPLFAALFEYAEIYGSAASDDSVEVKKVVKETLLNYLE